MILNLICRKGITSLAWSQKCIFLSQGRILLSIQEKDLHSCFHIKQINIQDCQRKCINRTGTSLSLSWIQRGTRALQPSPAKQTHDYHPCITTGSSHFPNRWVVSIYHCPPNQWENGFYPTAYCSLITSLRK